MAVDEAAGLETVAFVFGFAVILEDNYVLSSESGAYECLQHLEQIQH